MRQGQELKQKPKKQRKKTNNRAKNYRFVISKTVALWEIGIYFRLGQGLLKPNPTDKAIVFNVFLSKLPRGKKGC